MARKSTMGIGILVFALVITARAADQAKPNFSGLWRLNLGRSNFAGQGAPTNKIQNIKQRPNTLDVIIDEVTTGQPVHGTAHYTLDGKECVNNVLGHPMKATVTWDGAVLVMRTWGKYGDTDIVLVDRWSLLLEGKVLRMARHFEGHGETIDQVLVFNKQ